MTQDTNEPHGFDPTQGGGYSESSISAPKNSVAAIVGLITGATSLIPCLGFVTGPVGLVSSVIGFFTTGKPNVKGRWMAVLGFVLAIVGFIGVNIALIGGGGFFFFKKGMEAVSVPTETFVQALIDNDISAAREISSGFSDAELNELALQFDAVGDAATVDVTMNGFNLQIVNAEAIGTISGTASGDGKTLSFTSEVEGSSDLSDMNVTDLQVRD
ncbi:MAG: hypothetical protein AAGD32_07115 [Planctomycetota bacterium]